mmetsp:Transcript_86030/g.162090  ORF Transcript_86030/g.162090 Transcript_86030/m.162090 type:complete len:463 (-) Transcript_86030:114-1502(-)
MAIRKAMVIIFTSLLRTGYGYAHSMQTSITGHGTDYVELMQKRIKVDFLKAEDMISRRNLIGSRASIGEWDGHRLVQRVKLPAVATVAGATCDANTTIAGASVAVGRVGHPDYQKWAAEKGYMHFRMDDRTNLRQGHCDEVPHVRRALFQRHSKEGKGFAVALDDSEISHENIYHVMEMHSTLRCLGQLSTFENMTCHIKRSPKSFWVLEMLKLFCDVKMDGAGVAFRPDVHKEFHASHFWERWRDLNPVAATFSALARHHFTRVARIDPHVVMLQRPFGNRFIVDAKTHSFLGVIQAFCHGRVPIRFYSFSSNTPFAEQASAIVDASVLVAVHGAALTNMLWLPPGAAVIEILLRYGWCKDPVPVECRFPAWLSNCTASCRDGYHKADYANTAHTYGFQYFYLDPIYVDQPKGHNPIYVSAVHVNSTELVLLAEIAHAMVTDAEQRDIWKEQLRVLGMETE